MQIFTNFVSWFDCVVQTQYLKKFAYFFNISYRTPFNDHKLGGSSVYTDLTVSGARHIITVGENKKLRLGSIQWYYVRENSR
jgi:hypothetical protein